ncbi:MAG TPA: glycosyltransferase family 2 protein [Patescibacteria group bacterium]|nr:glycosyltransferase family 2 protein [Patescibacteria group bacterium]
MKPKVSIIIVNFNGGEVFENCLQSIKKLDYTNYETIVFDNGSRDGTQKYASLKSKKNIGFVGGNNEALKIAKGKYILLLNNDTLVKKDLLDVMVNKMESDETIGVIQPKIYLMDKKDYLDNAGSFWTNIGFLDHWGFNQKDSKEYDSEREIFSAKGACMMIRKDLIKKIGLFDEDYFAYFEESDFCFRVWIAGKRVVYFPKTSIQHKVGFTTKRSNVSFLNYLYYRNRIQCLIKNLEVKDLISVLSAHFFVSLGIAFVFLIRGSIENFFLVMRAIKWNFVNLNATLKKRKNVQNYRVYKDEEIFARVGHKVNWSKFFGDFKRIEKDLAK